MKNEIVELVFDETEESQLPAPSSIGIVVGIVKELDNGGRPLVDFIEKASGDPLPAKSTVVITTQHIGCEAILAFEHGDLAKPIIIGLLQPPAPRPQPEVHVDGERLVFTAEKEIVLQCGEASITLTRAGKVLIRGAHLLSRSSGVNRIKGGSVDIN
jgi:Domain of unknown function (DUF6484)